VSIERFVWRWVSIGACRRVLRLSQTAGGKALVLNMLRAMNDGGYL
jgi:hypothetical protein